MKNGIVHHFAMFKFLGYYDLLVAVKLKKTQCVQK